MTNLATMETYWNLASHEDQIRALVLLSGLPARDTDNAGLDKAAYFIGLEGTTGHGLEQAVRRILQGGLGHTFFPTVVELRRLHDEVMRPLHSARDHERLINSQRKEGAQLRSRHAQTKTPEARSRVAAILAENDRRYAETQAASRQEGIAETPDQIRARFIDQMGEAAFNSIPDLPVRDTFKQVGRAA